VLARTFARWLGDNHPADRVEVVAFRGGPLAAELARSWPVEVVLDHHEPWDWHGPDPDRVAELSARVGRLGPVDASLLVSVAAGQVLPLLQPGSGPIVTWAVEIGEDLHWLDEPVGLLDRTDRWLAGSQATAGELAGRAVPIAAPVVAEFVADPIAVAADERARIRAELGARDGDLLVLGAGIGTVRKGMDLFVEVAAGMRGIGRPSVRFAWVGGEEDPLFPLIAADVDRPCLDHVRLFPSVPDLDPWLAAADVFLHTARFDAFPLVCLQAAAHATPVVAFDGVGGVPQMLGPHFRGAPYPDAAGLAELVAGLADAGLRHELGSAQRTWVAERYLASAAAPALRAALVDVADGTRGVA
jgi:glycosyltransferase involved in cell wall biosynthesis